MTKECRSKSAMNILNFPNLILAHIMGHVGFKSSRIFEVCKKFNECPILVTSCVDLIGIYAEKRRKIIRKFVVINDSMVEVLLKYDVLEKVDIELLLERIGDKIAKLSLRSCKNVNDDVMSVVANMSGLQVLDLCGCSEITDVGLGYLRDHVRLNSLNLQWCGYGISGRTLGGIGIGIKKLSVFGTYNFNPNNLSNLVNLEELDITCAKEHIVKIGCLRSLRVLSLHCNEGGILNICNLVDLEDLSLQNCEGIVVPKQINNKLRKLEIRSCKFDEETWFNLGQCIGLVELCIVNISDGLTEKVLREFALNLINLREMKIKMCKMACISHLGGIGENKLRTLCIELSDDCKNIGVFDGLYKLYIWNKGIDDVIIRGIENMKELKDLELSDPRAFINSNITRKIMETNKLNRFVVNSMGLED